MIKPLKKFVPRSMSRALTLAGLAALVLPAAASADSVTVQQNSTFGCGYTCWTTATTVQYTGGSQANNLTVSHTAGGRIIFSDPTASTLSVDARCRLDSATTASCPESFPQVPSPYGQPVDPNPPKTAVTVSLGDGNDVATSDFDMSGYAAGSTAYLNPTIHGDGGNDALTVTHGPATLFGDAGSDTIHGGPGVPWLTLTDYVWGGDGADVIDVHASSAHGADYVSCGAGVDAVTGDTGIDAVGTAAADPSRCETVSWLS